ncbi:hypothetical protein MHBO_000770 [Bonamia ostreae]|uniref:Citrate synthase n=1 Tax=Bonamia ostreae TaxID=126728 RepID=A0ABV2AGR1_9EUKA
MSPYSKFRKAYFERAPKTDLWYYAFEDAMDMIARTPLIAARIYRNLYHGGKQIENVKSEDISGNFARLLGFDKFEVDELMRLYMTIHSDHEGGNVSSHTAHLVGSAMSDPYLAFSASINGLAGPLHGLANQEVLTFLKSLDKKFPGEELTIKNLSKEIKATLDKGQLVPGFGHAVLRVTDPRYTLQSEFARIYLDKNDRLYKIVKILNELVPSILKGFKKIQNPYNNVDGHSGTILNYFGLTQSNFYTVLFAVSRCIGVNCNLIISRIYGLPIERPKSATTKWIAENI